MIIHYLESLDSFKSQNQNKRLLLVGAGRNCIQFLDFYEWTIWNIVDSDSKKHGKCLQGCRAKGMVVSWETLLVASNVESGTYDVIVITPDCYEGLLKQICDILRNRDVDIYLYSYMYSLQWDFERNMCSKKPYVFSKGENAIIPKKIHAFWLSGEPLSEGAKKCYDSWKKYCPDYEITIWDKDTYHTDNQFCTEALENKQWAFASDYARCDVVYRYGGIYLDLDVELVKPLDSLLFDEAFFCFESADGGVDPGSGFGSVSRNAILGKIRDKYEGIHFVNEDGSYNRVSILRQYTDVLIENGLIQNGEYQKIRNMVIYPPLVMSPYSYRTGLISDDENTHGIHHWASAWISEEQRYYLEKKKRYMKEHEREVRMIINGEE